MRALHGTVNNCPTSPPKNSPFRKYSGALDRATQSLGTVLVCHPFSPLGKLERKTISPSSQKSINSVLRKKSPTPNLLILLKHAGRRCAHSIYLFILRHQQNVAAC